MSTTAPYTLQKTFINAGEIIMNSNMLAQFHFAGLNMLAQFHFGGFNMLAQFHFWGFFGKLDIDSEFVFLPS